MPSIRIKGTASATDALTGLKFKSQGRPSMVSLFASGDNAANAVSLSVGSRELLVSAPTNLQATAGCIDTDRDQLLFREPAPAGEFFMPTSLTGTLLDVLLVIEPV